jgi:ubiquinone/menaquinone biosynthesis C-methylase UbiE
MAGDHKNMYRHFSQIAPSYGQVRRTDIRPIQFISERLQAIEKIRAADIACGDGRYDLLLFEYLENLHLTCVDINESMLRQASKFLKGRGIKDFIILRANAVDLPLKDNSMDCIFTFNAIHHFDLNHFIESAAKTVRIGGLIFIYTRLQTQNARTLWGKYFPLFLDKERRLYELTDITEAVHSTSSFIIEFIKEFRFRRKATLDELVDKVYKKHYSTFSLYGDNELEHCIEEFRRSIMDDFGEEKQIEWFDENVLIVMRLES